MRARLTKVQIQMLLDGKTIKHLHNRFGIADGENELRKFFQEYIENEEMQKQYAVFFNTDKNQVEIGRR